jgi:folate-binding protein YgfZ
MIASAPCSTEPSNKHQCNHQTLVHTAMTTELIPSKTSLIALADQGLIRASGPDAESFLQNLLTNSVKDIAPGESRLAGFCTPKGRLLALFHVWKDSLSDGDLMLMLPRELLPAMLRKLSMYVLRSKVKLSDVSDGVALLGVATAEGAVPPELTFAGAQCISLNKTASPGLHVLVGPNELMADSANAAAAQSQQIDLPTWHWLQIVAGVPSVVAATQEAFVPQMLNMELRAVGGISFSKGCYPGQEIVARTQYLGKIKRRMYRGVLPSEPIGGSEIGPGTALYTAETGDQQCGALVSVAPNPQGGTEALICVQSGAVDANDVRLGVPTGPQLRILGLPYALDGPDTRGT